MPSILDRCPEPSCTSVYRISRRWVEASANGPIEKMTGSCLKGHRHYGSALHIEEQGRKNLPGKLSP